MDERKERLLKKTYLWIPWDDSWNNCAHSNSKFYF